MTVRIVHPPAQPGRYLEVELAHVHLTRGANRVLRGLSWRIRPGQHWVLQGANGSGKTQLLKLIAGAVWPQPRRQTRRSYRWRGERSAEPRGVLEEIAYLGAERQDRYEHYGWNYRVDAIVGTGLQRSDVPLRPLSAGERRQVALLLRRLGIAALARRRLLSISQGQRRLVLLARALAARPALLLLDEPLNGLDARGRARLLAALAGLRRRKLPWVYATHRPEEVPAGATHWAQLRAGRLRTGRYSRQRPARTSAAGAPRALAPAQRGARTPLIELHNAWVWRGGRAALRGVTLPLRRGECWVVHGPNGSGKSTLLGVLHGEFGVAGTGAIVRRGHGLGLPLEDFQRRVGLITPDLQAGLPRQLTALETVVAGLRGAFALERAPRLRERLAARRSLRRVGALALAPRTLGELSYGQARRVLFARALVRQPAIVLLDEPFTGLDAATRARLRALLRTYAGKETTVVIATHHRDEWPAAATHELELAGGRVTYCGPTRRVRARRGVRNR